MISKMRQKNSRLAAIAGALVASAALLALAVGPASASAAQHWYSCQSVTPGTGQFNNSGCTEKGGSLSYALKQLTPGTSTSTKGTGSGIKLETNFGGATLVANCSMATTGTVENPVGGGAGKGTAAFNISACVVKTPMGYGCKIVPFTIHTPAVSLTEESGTALVRFGTNASDYMTIEGCAGGPFNGTKVIGHSFDALPSASVPGLYELPKNRSGLTYGAFRLWIWGNLNLSTEAGNPLAVAP